MAVVVTAAYHPGRTDITVEVDGKVERIFQVHDGEKVRTYTVEQAKATKTKTKATKAKATKATEPTSARTGTSTRTSTRTRARSG